MGACLNRARRQQITTDNTDHPIVPVVSQEPVVAIRPYCGASTNSIPQHGVAGPHSGDADCQVYKTPPQAWADLGLVKHMQAAVVPEAVKIAGPPNLKARFEAGRCVFRFSTILLSVMENVFGYLAYLQVAPVEDSLYNKFEAHMLGYPGLDMILLVLTISNTCYLFLFWMMIAFMRRDLYGVLVTGRLFLSLPMGCAYTVMVFFGESTKIFPFFCASLTLLHLLVWTCGLIMRSKSRHEGKARDEETPLNCAEVTCGCFGFVLLAWVVAFVLMFLTQRAPYFYDSECPATKNTAMPVRINGLREWQCVKWGEPHYIRRITPPGQPIQDALCSTSFYSFNKVVNAITGQQVPSSEAHYARCPSNCQELGLATSVIGCKIYSASSSICAAAVQMGILEANAGGIVKAVGRPPPSSSSTSEQYEQCNRNGIISEAPANVSDGFPPWAFYLQAEGTESLDMVTIHSWRKTGSPRIQQPWKSYVADVTWVVGGTQQRQEVVLGPGGAQDIELNFCRGSKSCT